MSRLWLWRNWVDGRPEYWAFDNPYPLFMDSDDPQTLGEPCGYAIVKPSRRGRPDVRDEDAAKRIKSDATRIAELEREVGAWRSITKDAQDHHRASMVELSKTLGVEDPENEPRFKWVEIRASEVMRRVAELEATLKLAGEALSAMLTHMGMDEDEWNKPTFDQARAALQQIKEVR